MFKTISKVFQGKPPKTTFENFIYIPHLERVLLWFLNNDEFFKTLKGTETRVFFEEGYGTGSECLEELWSQEQSANKNPYRFVVMEVWCELVHLREATNIKSALKARMDEIGYYIDGTIQRVVEIAEKHGLDVTDFDPEDVDRLETRVQDEFKRCYVDDAIHSAKLRLLAWTYRDLFDENYEMPENR